MVDGTEQSEAILTTALAPGATGLQIQDPDAFARAIAFCSGLARPLMALIVSLGLPILDRGWVLVSCDGSPPRIFCREIVTNLIIPHVIYCTHIYDKREGVLSECAFRRICTPVPEFLYTPL